MIFLNVTDWFSSLDEAVQFFLILGFATTVITCCALVMSAWNKTRRNDNSSRLTSQMLERGMSAAEVAQVLLAAKIANDENTEGDADPEVALVKHLSNRLYSANDVKIILDGVPRRREDRLSHRADREDARQPVDLGREDRGRGAFAHRRRYDRRRNRLKPRLDSTADLVPLPQRCVDRVELRSLGIDRRPCADLGRSKDRIVRLRANGGGRKQRRRAYWR